VQLALAAEVDPSRMVTESVAPQRHEVRFQCDIAGKGGICTTRHAGPLVVTDARVPTGCPTELYIGATDLSHNFAWLVQANAPGMQGGRYFVRADQSLTVAARGVTPTAQADARCLVTWAGFRPRIVPANL
jgi:hypothetical protein